MSGHAGDFVAVGRRVATVALIAAALIPAALIAAALSGPAVAQDFQQPSGRPVLTVDGAIGASNIEGKAVFDMPMLQLMPQVTFRTSTVWTEGVLEFTGVPLRAVLDSLGADDSVSVSAKAINDYAVEIPAAAITDEAPIIAYHIDGKEFSRREKGPLWVIFPYDSDERYRTEVTFGQSIWQLDRLTVKK